MTITRRNLLKTAAIAAVPGSLLLDAACGGVLPPEEQPRNPPKAAPKSPEDFQKGYWDAETFKCRGRQWFVADEGTVFVFDCGGFKFILDPRMSLLVRAYDSYFEISNFWFNKQYYGLFEAGAPTLRERFPEPYFLKNPDKKTTVFRFLGKEDPTWYNGTHEKGGWGLEALDEEWPPHQKILTAAKSPDWPNYILIGDMHHA